MTLGYVTATGRPNQARFIAENGYPDPTFYGWTAGKHTPTKFTLIEQLARDLDVTVCWLLLGDAGERAVLRRHRSRRVRATY